MRITAEMFNKNPNLSPIELMEKISKERHKLHKRMPTRNERRAETEIKQMEEKQ